MLVIMLPTEIPNLSPFACLLLIIYPVYELLRTMFSRIISQKALTHPDMTHLHSLVFSYFLKRNFGNGNFSNSLSAFVILPINAINCGWVISFYSHTNLLILGIIFLSCVELYFMVKKRWSVKLPILSLTFWLMLENIDEMKI